jgi:hypothetical protein
MNFFPFVTLLLSLGYYVSAFSVLPERSTLSRRRLTPLRSSATDPQVSKKAPPIPTNKDNTLIILANEFIYTSSGFYSAADPSFYSDDFIFRGPYIGPLNKKDYLATMDTFKIYEGLPDISPNAFGFSIDPKNPNRVWFLVRNSGTFTGKPGIGLGYGQYFPPNGAKLEGCPETFSITFDDNQKVKHLTVGYVADRFEGNTKGKGAAIGIFEVIGLPIPPPGPVYSLITWFNNKILGNSAKTCSEDVPEWWPHEERGAEGYK